VGQLGVGNTTEQGRAVKVKKNANTELSGVVDIAAGSEHGVAVVVSGTEQGTVWCWGQQAYGRLGNGQGGGLAVTYPVKVEKSSGGYLENIVEVSASPTFTMAVDADGNVWSWGHNYLGQLGNGTGVGRFKADKVLVSGTTNYLEGIETIAAGGTGGYDFGLAVKGDGSVHSWGYGESGQLGNGGTVSSSYAVNGGAGIVTVNKGPSVQLNVGGPYAEVPAEVILSATATDADGAVAEVAFYNGDTLLGADSIAPFEFSWQGVGAGTYAIRAVATDNVGGRGEALETLTVNVPEGELLTRRFSRGTEGAEAAARSFVIPLDFQTGVGLEAIGNNASLYPGGVPWFLDVNRPVRRHLTVAGGNAAYGLQFQNPIAAFGNEAGGSPLYLGRTYRFGINAGQAFSNYVVQVRVKIYVRTTRALVEEIYLPIPRPNSQDSTEEARWQAFVANGFVWPTSGITETGYQRLEQIYGLKTSVQRLEVGVNSSNWNLNYYQGLILSHRASNPDFLFMVESVGLAGVNGVGHSFVKTDDLQLDDFNSLYAISFDDVPPWRAETLTRPMFDGEPLPSHYAGKSVPELLNKRLADIPVNIPNPQNYLALDTTPELRVHPDLDSFITEITGGLSSEQKALAVANYVANEVRLIDALGYPEPVAPNTAPNMSEQAIFAPGMKRNAYGTFLEGQGSPYEQCALLVYMLRKVGTPAAYVFPARNEMKMLDMRLSKLLGFQIRGVMDHTGELQTEPPDSGQPTLIPVNWPWVAAYIDGQWVNIFPWIKDVEIEEGLSPYEYLPVGYNSGSLWLHKYLNRDPAILNLNTDDDTPSTLFESFLKKELADNHPALNIDDIGMKVRHRRVNYSSWQEMPTPFAITGTTRATALLSGETDLFDTIKVTMASAARPTYKMETAELPLMEVLNRRWLFKFTRTTASNLIANMVLSPFRPSATGTGAFANTFSTLEKKQTLTYSSFTPSADPQYKVSINLKMHRRFWKPFAQYSGQSASNRWENYLGLSEGEQINHDAYVAAGDLAALCLAPGRVTFRQIEPHLREYIKVQEQAKANPGSTSTLDPDIYQGGIVHLLGMNYYQRLGEGTERLASLHKNLVSQTMAMGFAKLIAKKNTNGLLPDGTIELVQPNVDMMFNLYGYIGNNTTRPDSGAPTQSLHESDFSVLRMAETSAQEHRAIDTFFKEADSISTVRLLHIAHKNHAENPSTYPQGMLLATDSNYASFATYFTGTNANETDLWNKIAAFFVTSGTTPAPHARYSKAYLTPGPVTGANGKYRGVGALVFAPNQAAAWIGGNKITNGGYGRTFNYVNNNPPFTSINLPNVNVGISSKNYVSVSYGGSSSSSWSVANSVNVSTGNFGNFYSAVTAPSSSFSITTTMQGWTMQNYTALNLGPPPSSWNSSTYFGTAQLSVLNRGTVGALTSSFQYLTNLVSDPVHVITGSFYVDAVDLTLPGPMALELRRNYDSKSMMLGALGYGWKLSIVPYLVVAEGDETIYAAEKDGSVIAYVRSGTSNTWEPTPAANPGLTNVRGEGEIGATANPFNAKLIKSIESGTTFYRLTGADGSERTFRVRSFPLTYSVDHDDDEETPAETMTAERERPYLEKWEDNRGNSLTFTFGEASATPEYGELTRIVSSNGNFLGFFYDSYRHMIEAFSGDGRRVYYDYDSQGDLKKTTLPDGSEVSYAYQMETTGSGTSAVTTSTHLLVRENKPEGRVLENTYDSDRRVTSQKATVGGDYVPVTNATFVYTGTQNSDNSHTGATEITDALGKTTRYEYTDSLITKIKDPAPLNYEDVKEWYADSGTTSGAYPRSLKKTIDKRGLIQEFQYDASGNVVERKLTGDLTGDGASDTATTTCTYNVRNLPLEIVEAAEAGPAAQKKVFTYGDTAQPWLPTSIGNYAGGTLISRTDYNYYDVVTTPSKAYGLVQQVKVAAGSADEAVTTFTHDSNGWLTSETKQTGTGDPAVARTLSHNLRGELVEATDALGRRTGHAYDGRGNRIWTEVHDENGTLVSWEYRYFNRNGEIEWMDGPRYYPEDYVLTRYDGAGRPKEKLVWRSEADPGGHGVRPVDGQDAFAATTLYKHDAFGNLTEVLDPRHNAATMEYDAIGRLAGRKLREGGATGAVLSQESFTHEPGNEIFQHTNPLGGVTAHYYTAAGQLRRRENPDGSVLEWRYDLYGRPVREILSNGSYWETAYNDAARTVTRTFRDAGGASLAVESQTRDRRGNVVSATNAEGHTFVSTYDDLNRVKTSQGPAAGPGSGRESLEYIYDAAGKTTIVRDALGHGTVTTRDALGRTVLVERKDQHGTVVHRRAFEYSADHHAVTTVEGAQGSPLRTTVYTDTEGREVLVKKGDGGFRVNAYDPAGNLDGAKDEAGHVTVNEYDAANRLTRTTLPGGAEITLVPDAAGNTLERRMPGNVTHKRTYDNASRVLTEELRNGGSVTRQFGYAYFTGGANTGLLQTVSDPRGVTLTQSYDAFLRKAGIVATGSAAAQNMSVSYGYDLLGNINTIGQSYSGTGVGATTLVERERDAYGDVLTETVKIDGAVQSEFAQEYDAARRRTGLEFTPAAQGQGAGRSYAFAYRADGALKSVNAGGVANAFTYGMDGLLKTRSASGVTHRIEARDTVGRPIAAMVTVNGMTVLSESVSWQLDGKMGGYTATREGTSTLGVQREFAYNARGQLFNEEADYSSGAWNNQAYRFDRESTPAGTGLGVRTLSQRQVATSGTNDLEPGSWQAKNAANPATNPLDAFGRPVKEGPIVGSANAYEERTSHYDAAGNQTQRGLAGGINQTLTWDAFGRLVEVNQRDASGNGFDFAAIYDGLGRRIQTVKTEVHSAIPDPQSAFTTESYFDPMVEFLEVGVAVDGDRVWKVYGPDLSGNYGGLQGTGGLLSTIEEATGTQTFLISDHYGNALARVSSGTLQWSEVEFTAYGLGPDSTVESLVEPSDLAAVTLWRGQRQDVTGLHWMGMRYYDSSSGRFLSTDPLGHSASLSLYDYASGDPVNFVDPDGRLSTGFKSGWSGSVSAGASNSFGFNIGMSLGGMTSGGVSGGGNGAGGLVNAISFGSIHGAFGSDVNSYEYGLGRNITYGTMGTVAAVATGGVALQAAGGGAGLYVAANNIAYNPILHAAAGTTIVGASSSRIISGVPPKVSAGTISYSMKAVRSRWWGGSTPVRPNPVMPRGREYMELSHTYISNNGTFGRQVPEWIKNRGWNLNPMWGSNHALVDPQRYQFMSVDWRSANKIHAPIARLWERMPASHRIGVGIVGGSGIGYGLYETLNGDQ
jgi:RHS repeat-associated protein